MLATKVRQEVLNLVTPLLQPVYYKSPAVLLYSENRNDDVSIVQDLFSHVSLDNYIIFNEGKTIKIFYWKYIINADLESKPTILWKVTFCYQTH